MSHIGMKESMTVEFKSDLKSLPDNDLIDAIVAFANADGGELYLGVEDDGEVTGLHKNHADTTRLAAFVANKTVPPVPVRTEILDFDRPVLKISVPKRLSVVSSSSGKIQRRRLKTDGTPENVPMYPYEIATRLSSLNLLDYSAQIVPSADRSDLDPVERERLRNIIRRHHGEGALLDLNDEDLDKALQFVKKQGDKLVPTFCGLLMIGREESLKIHMPTAEAAIQVLQGTDIRVNESFTLPILAAYERINEKFSAWNSSEEIGTEYIRTTIYDYDPRAFREALVNAFCHRDYSRLGRVRVQINDEGMTIASPGGFVEGISANNLLEAEPHGRNVILADAMKRIGLAERTGRGIDRIYEGSLLNGRLLPDYANSTANRVVLFIPKSPSDKAFVQMISAEQKRTGRSIPIYSLLILNALKNLPRATVYDVAKTLEIDENRARASLEVLTESGIVEASGNGHRRHYSLNSNLYRSVEKTAKYIRVSGGDAPTDDERVLQRAKQQGKITRKDVIHLLHITPPQAYRLLQKLVKEEKLSPSGQGAGAKYLLK